MRTADKFCDLAGFDPEREEAVVYAHDGSQVTLIEIDGIRSIVSPDDYLVNVVERFAGGIAQILKRPGHQLTISYESSLNTAKVIEPFVERQGRRARQKGLSVEALIEEGRAVLEERARSETILLAAWTRPTAGTPEEVRREQRDNRRAWQELPPAHDAQNPYLRLGSLDGVHAAFVRRVMEALGEARLQGRILAPDGQGRRRDLEQIRAAVLYHETPDGWTPYGPGTRRYPGAKERHDDDVSDFFTPTVARQIMTSNAQASSNMRALDMGGRRYALAVMRMFPSSILPFNRLLDSLLESSSRSADMPFRVCFHLEALRDADVGFRLKKVLAGLLAFASPSNKNLFRALRQLEEVVEKDGEAIVKGRVIATTWTEPGEDPGLLERRRSYLMSGMMTWGEAVMTDAPHNPLRALCETVAGMTVQAEIPPGSIAPLGDLAAMLPFQAGRDAREHRGQQRGHILHQPERGDVRARLAGGQPVEHAEAHIDGRTVFRVGAARQPGREHQPPAALAKRREGLRRGRAIGSEALAGDGDQAPAAGKPGQGRAQVIAGGVAIAALDLGRHGEGRVHQDHARGNARIQPVVDLGCVELRDRTGRVQRRQEPGPGRGQLVEMEARAAQLGVDREQPGAG